MKILHCCLSNFYVDGFNYQENMLVSEHVRAGHEVLVLASTENYHVDGKLTYSKPGSYLGMDEAEVLRLPYRKLGPHAIMKKIRTYPGVYQQLSKFNPDVIVFHGASAFELLTVVRYKKNNPSVRLYVDNHSDFNNSARSFISKNLLHRLFYRPIFKKSIPYVDKVLCISLEAMNFIEKLYECPIEKIEYLPLGGVVFSDELHNRNRMTIRERYNISKNTLVFLQAGKFDSKKKLAESIRAFHKLPYVENVQFLIVGVLQEDVKTEVEELILKDGRVCFLGWKNSKELLHLLCAADVYVQPGSQSATLQNSICCRCAVLVNDVPSHKPFVKGNGWFVRDSDTLTQGFEDAIQAFKDGSLVHIREKSLYIAKQLLDYKKIAHRLTE